MNDFLNDTTFKSPFTCLIAGPTQSGKTTFIEKVLIDNKLLIKPNVNKIIYCYARWQTKYDQLKSLIPNIEFNEGLYDFENINSNDQTLLILDDLTHLCEKDETVLNLFTTDSHQKNISVFLLTQNIFSKGKHFRTISLNSHYLILMNNPRDRQQISNLAKQMFPKKNEFLVEAYHDATINKYGYLFVDLTQSTNQNNRVQSGILQDEIRVIYRPK
jgi:Cdc6-like AAA superfamily ATPase